MSSFQTKATGMYVGMFLFGKVARKVNTKTKVMMWTDNEVLVRIRKKFLEDNPISAYMKNDPGLYVGMREASKELEVLDVSLVECHQDRTGRVLSAMDKLNVLADKLATKAVGESQIEDPERTKEIGPMLIIVGTPITNKADKPKHCSRKGRIQIVVEK